MNNTAFLRNCFLSGILLLLSSCITNKKATYFQDISEAQQTILKVSAKYTELTIKPDDILSITITTIDPQSVSALNQGASLPVVGAASSSGAAQPLNGFLVNKNGEIQLAMIGVLKVAGLSTFEAKELIQKKAKIYYKDPDVQVRFANFRVTVLGEVNRPSTYTIPNEQVSVLDVLGLAGDLTVYGMRENIMVVRANDNQTKEFGRLNISSAEIFNSPYFYLKQNDIIYVEANKSKIAASDANRTRLITIGTSIASALIVLAIRLR
ncbi:MAG: hypothetical protein EOO43_03365 [Flavobacterium sp.]|nr:MAG: hypothetical protein EOO43_03365 [Flavobacterium sp.]